MIHETLIQDVTIRPFETSRDASVIRALAGDVWRGSGYEEMERRFGVIGGRSWREWLCDAVMHEVGADETRSYVAEAEGEIVGFCSYTVDTARSRGTVGYNGVARHFQGRGLGSAMLQYVLSRMRAEGMRHAGVIVADNDEHAPAKRMYEKQGFRELTANRYLIQQLDADV